MQNAHVSASDLCSDACVWWFDLMLQIWHFHLERENDSICDFKSNVCWIACNCFFKVHSCTGVHVSSACTQTTPDLFSDQTSLLSLSFIHSFIPLSQLSVWRISCCSQPWDWIESFCLALFPSSTHEEEDRSGRSHNEHFSIHSYDFTLSISLVVMSVHNNVIIPTYLRY